MIWCWSSLVVAAASVPLVRDGRPTASIVLAPEPTLAAAFAAEELQHHLRLITGASLPIVRDAGDGAAAHVFVGDSPAVRALGFRAEDYGDQEHEIAFRPGAVVLLGRDDAAAGPGPTRAAGRFGRAAEFDGARPPVVVTDARFDDRQGTLEAWVELPATPAERSHATILRLDGSDPWTYHILQVDQGTRRISYTSYDGTNGHRVESRGDVPAGWHHVAGTYDAAVGRLALWIDGDQQGETDYLPTTCAASPLGIGGMAEQGGNPFSGRIDEVRLSNVVRAIGMPDAPFELDEATVCLVDFDEGAGPAHNRAGGQRAVPPPLFGQRGTLDAAYDFLERYCDVRWYAPTELGTVYPERSTLVISGEGVRRAPAMRHRWITPTALYLPGPPDRVAPDEVHRWKLRLRIGGQAFWVCHSFEGYYDRFLAEHPDWFAQGYDGRPPQMCYTSPDLLAQVVRDARDYFDGKGKQPGAAAEGDVFGIVPQDNNSWCRCPRCQAELNQAEAANPQFNNGKASDLVWGFVNRVALEVAKTHPDKWIGALAYSDYAYYPTKFELAQNIIVQTCLHTRNWWCPSMEANDRRVLAEFRRRDPERPLYLWLYYNFPALNAQYGGWRYFPGFFAHAAVEQMDLYREAGAQGIFMEHSSEFGQTWLMDQLEFYVTLKLADDPTLDGNALIDEFFARYYGAAGPPMQALYNRIEAIYSRPDCYPQSIRDSPGHQHQTEQLAWEHLGTTGHLAELAPLMAEAEAADLSPAERARVAWFRAGLWDYMLAGRAEYDERAARRDESPRSLRVPRVAGADGQPGRLDWAIVPVQPGWAGLGGEPTDRDLELRLAHDGRWLYVALSEEVGTTQLVTGRQVWDGDDWEIIVAAARGAAHRQLCIAPDGSLWRQAHGEETAGWEAGEVVMCGAEGGRWTVRVALPLDRLLPEPAGPGGRIFANFYRASPGATRLLAWAPTFASGFHDTSRLAELTLD